jgi:hypothetical protein
MIYKLYRKAKDEHSGQILAVIAQKVESAVINEIALYIFKNGVPVELYHYAGDEMKIPGEGRPIWAEVTWPPSGKWEELNEPVELTTWAKNHILNGDNAVIGNLSKFFI